eukprot:CAMPEP_0197715256 /NCGR_PEP_ID=MMETSP1434-20131217/460_1 /TAXON_ID=265543 /ORGANISM="Minutocellus polymorphus, Strain CCMP3303" /LENGTH=94 /DNA_ID=CAMNT_0043299323 /DNA_START=87 /DNA_END=371 /DNA_ORIENTATION=+
MSRSFVLSLLAVALVASGCDAFVPPQPTSTTSSLFAENNFDEQPTRRDVFRPLAVGGMIIAASPSAALAHIVVDTDEFGQEVEYDDEDPDEEEN